MGRRLLCLKIAKEPVDIDPAAFMADSASSHHRDQWGSRASDAESEDEPELSRDAVPAPYAASDGSVNQDLEEDARLVPEWTPLRHFNNMIFDIVDAAGTEGVSTKVIVNFSNSWVMLTYP